MTTAIALGDQVAVTFLDGSTKQLAVQGIFDSKIFGDYLMNAATFQGTSNPVFDSLIVISAKPSADLSATTTQIKGVVDQFPTAKFQTAGRVHQQPDRSGRHVPQLHLRPARHVDLHRHPRHRDHAAAVGVRAPARARADACRRHDPWPGGREHAVGVRPDRADRRGDGRDAGHRARAGWSCAPCATRG